MLHNMRRKWRLFLELAKGGGRLREMVLLNLLEKHYDSKFRREWVIGLEPPHFDDNRRDTFDFAFSANSVGAYPLYRGFLSSEVIQEGDRLLDIGCGDGFFTRRFFAEKCSSIDAVDIEHSAIKAAMEYNSSEKITYHQLDAVNQPFPNSPYEVVVWDGAIGHFSADTTDIIVEKISASLVPDGIFVGSESLSEEECKRDHLLLFYSLDDLHRVFKNYFKYIELRSVQYKINKRDSFIRTEGYWRCSNKPTRLESNSWKKFYS
jgi:2-polyprenyl-3-methyl-5-hydroxy-6-metoxy-1,4-benzoquinol methylase